MSNVALADDLTERLNADLDAMADEWSSGDLWESVVNGHFIILPRETASAIAEQLRSQGSSPEQMADLATEIAADVRDETFEGDKWMGFAKTREVVEARLAKEHPQAINAELLSALKASDELLRRILRGEEWGAIEEYLDDNADAIAKAKGTK